MPQVRSCSQGAPGTSTLAPDLSSSSTLSIISSAMSMFECHVPWSGNPCSDEDMPHSKTLAKANCGAGKKLTKNLSLGNASFKFKFGVTNSLTICNSSGKIEEGNYSSNEIANIFSNNGHIRHCLSWILANRLACRTQS